MSINLTPFELQLQLFANNVTTANTSADFLNIAKAIKFTNSGQISSYNTLGGFPAANTVNLQFAIDSTNSSVYYSNGTSWIAVTPQIPPTSLTNPSATTGIASNVVSRLANTAVTAFSILEANTAWNMWACGYAVDGGLGLGSTITFTSPVPVSTPQLQWKAVACGYHSGFGITVDNSLYSWGNAAAGQLGQGSTTNISTPAKVGLLSNWLQVGTGFKTTAAVKTDGTLWSWGDGTNNSLGQGNTTSLSSPVQVGTATNWKQVSGALYTFGAVTRDGKLYTWGIGSNGGLGQGSTTAISTPVQVGALANWKSVSMGQSSGYAIKTDGTMWSWGANGNGQLGLGDTFSRSSPVQVGAGTNWAQIAFNGASWCGIKTDGTLWSCGYGGAATYNPLGTGFTGNYSTPVQVGALNNWKQVAITGASSAFAVKNDGTLWCWGNNAFSILGLGSSAQNPVLQPTQLNVAQIYGFYSTNWRFAASGSYLDGHMLLLTYPISASVVPSIAIPTTGTGGAGSISY
jgi:alpha-tubulin suppressor-like RCC1 family protein